MFWHFLRDVVYIVGLIYTAKHVFAIAHGLYVQFIRNNVCRKIDLLKKYGTWAVVTGGSDGLGECYCRELAARGMNIFIISEKLNRLKEVTKQLETEFGVQTMFCHADLRGGEEVYLNIASQLQLLDIGVLVNNAGVLVPYPMSVDEMTHDLIMTHILVNMAAPTLMCKIVAPLMKARKRGVIVNIASISEVAGTPYFGVYAATKTYVRSLSEAIGFELKDFNIDVQVVTPAFLRTGMVSFSDVIINYLATDAPEFARKAVDTIGVTSKTGGCFLHDTQHYFARIVPSSFTTLVAGHLMLYIRKNRDEKPQQRNLKGVEHLEQKILT